MTSLRRANKSNPATAEFPTFVNDGCETIGHVIGQPPKVKVMARTARRSGFSGREAKRWRPSCPLAPRRDKTKLSRREGLKNHNSKNSSTGWAGDDRTHSDLRRRRRVRHRAYPHCEDLVMGSGDCEGRRSSGLQTHPGKSRKPRGLARSDALAALELLELMLCLSGTSL